MAVEEEEEGQNHLFSILNFLFLSSLLNLIVPWDEQIIWQS